MTVTNMPEIPVSYRPDQTRFGFDVPHALKSVVALRAEVPENAFTAGTLGTERTGHGIVIGKGLVLTIGYLIVEAEKIWLVTGTGSAVAGHVLAYDQETGFGLVQALGTLDATAIELGSSADLIPGDDVIFAGAGGMAGALAARVTARREFAGYWEYLIDDAIFTSPAHPLWGGGALIGEDGTLRGVGSLFVQEGDDESTEANMIVPIDILKPILPSLKTTGGSGRLPRPWLGTFTAETSGRVIIVGTWAGGPAERAGLDSGDIIIGVDDRPVDSMAQFFRRLWSLGDAGVDVPLTIYRDGKLSTISIRSAARGDYYRGPDVH